MHFAYWLTPFLIIPVLLVFRLAWKTSHPGLFMVAVQFSCVAAFEVLIDCIYVVFTQDNLIDEPFIDAYLFQSFFASALQYNIFAAMLWGLFSKRRFSTPGTGWFGEREIKFASVFVVTAAILSLYTIVSEGGLQFTYGNVAIGQSLEEDAGAWGPIALFVQLGTLYAVFCLVKGSRGGWLWRIAYLFSIILVGLFALKVMTGARAAVFTLAMYAISVAVLLRKNLRNYLIVAGMAGGIVIGIFGTFSNVRITGITLGIGEAAELLSTGLSSQISEADISQIFRQSVRDFAWRSGGARMGSVLFADVDMRGVVGLQAVINNAFSIIPRTLWTDRPYGNSIDGSASGLATYQVSQILRGSSDTNYQSDSVSGASVAYWTLGWIGVILSGAFSALVVWFITSKVWPKQPGFAWLFLLGLTWGGWYVIADVGTWLGQISRVGAILILGGVLSGIIKTRFAHIRSNSIAADKS